MAVCLRIKNSTPLGVLCVCVFADSVYLPREYNYSQQTQRLLCSFQAIWKKKKKWAVKSINQEQCCRKNPPVLTAREVFHHVALIELFIIWLPCFIETDQPPWAAFLAPSFRYFAFHNFTPSVPYQRFCCRLYCITFSAGANISALDCGRSQILFSNTRVYKCLCPREWNLILSFLRFISYMKRIMNLITLQSSVSICVEEVTVTSSERLRLA